jgi:hypothetical protein
VQAIETLQKKCIFGFTGEVRIVCNIDDNEGEIQVWSRVSVVFSLSHCDWEATRKVDQVDNLSGLPDPIQRVECDHGLHSDVRLSVASPNVIIYLIQTWTNRWDWVGIAAPPPTGGTSLEWIDHLCLGVLLGLGPSEPAQFKVYEKDLAVSLANIAASDVAMQVSSGMDATESVPHLLA